MPWFSAEEIDVRVGFRGAVSVQQSAVRAGPDLADEFSRNILNVDQGQLLLMPSQSAEYVGVTVASVAPGNPRLGRSRIQGIYLLMDAATLSPVALLDGIGLTTLRTPAVSAAVADLVAPTEVEQLVVFGSGTQAWGHVEATRAIRRISRVTVVGRHPGRSEALAERVRASGLPAQTGSPGAMDSAQLIVCDTTARTPLFDGSLVPPDSCTVAVGSHEPDARELRRTLIARAQVVVEESQVALREGGVGLIPLREGTIAAGSLVPMRGIRTGTVAIDHDSPRMFTSSGMSWQDLVVAAAVVRESRSPRNHDPHPKDSATLFRESG